jgi:hypothetical protein
LIPFKAPSVDKEAMWTRKGYPANNHLIFTDLDDTIVAIKAGNLYFVLLFYSGQTDVYLLCLLNC